MSGEDLLATYIATEMGKGFTLSPEYSYHISGSAAVNFEPAKYINDFGIESSQDQEKDPTPGERSLKRRLKKDEVVVDPSGGVEKLPDKKIKENEEKPQRGQE